MFDERERIFETQWQHDQELQFRVISRRNRLLGQWAAHLMGMTIRDADDYARILVDTEIARSGDAPIHDKLEADLKSAGVDLTDHRLRKQMDALLVDARHQIMLEVH